MNKKEINDFTAEKIMKWKFLPYQGYYREDDPIHLVRKYIDWNPYENISDAWLIVEELRLFVMPWGDKEWCVSKERDKHLAFQNITFANTAPNAICLWAIKNIKK